MRNTIENTWFFIGEKVINPILDWYRKKIEKFNIEITGIQNLESLKWKPFILAVNHLKPTNSIDQQSQLSPDAFVIEKIIRDILNEKLNIIAKCDDGWWSENFYRYFQEYISQPLWKWIIDGLGFIPIYKNPGTFNRSFLKKIKKTIEKNEPILIFPEWHRYDDFNPENNIESGTSHISTKYNIPILVVYIKWANKWDPNIDVEVNFSEAFTPEELSLEEINNLIKSKLTKLQEETWKKVYDIFKKS